MGLISPAQISDGTTIDAADVNTPINTIADEFNGNIENANIKAAAAIDGSKLADGGITTAKLASTATLKHPYRFRAYVSSAHNVGTASTKVQFNAESYDSNSNYDSATNYRYTAPVAGFYQFNATVGVTGAGSGTDIIVDLRKNGSAAARGTWFTSAAGATPSGVVSDILELAANDYVEVFVATGVAAKALATGAAVTFFSGHLLSTS